MAEINTAGYQSIRDYIQSKWNHLELRDLNGSAVLRINTTDSRLSWTHSPNSPTLELTVVVKGAEVSLPQSFASSAIFDVATGGTAYSEEPFTPFTMEGDGDELTVIHQIQVPKTEEDGNSGWSEW